MIRIPKMYCMGVLALALLMFLTMPALAIERHGTVINVNGDTNQFVILDDDLTELTFSLADDGTLFINGDEAQVSDLQAGDDLIITYELRNYENVATDVRCTR